MIDVKSEVADYGEQTVGNYSNASVDYNPHHKVPSNNPYDDAGPSSEPPQPDQWLDEKHFLTSTPTGAGPASNTSVTSDTQDPQRCKSTKNYKALEPCSCPLCARVYSNVSNLRQHMRLIHNPTSVCCPLCQKSFTSDLYLKRHYLSMHGSSTVPGVPGTQQSPQHQQAQPSAQTHTVDGVKHVNQPGSFHTAVLYKRDYADLQTTTPATDGKQQQQQQHQQQQQQMAHPQTWTYESKAELN